ncbi:MAG: formylglycine-generating enzyme family protein [Planctomycetales bacterium]|nr:formylglycine-generating enzyme family protein [Planctomycetales bacterium]
MKYSRLMLLSVATTFAFVSPLVSDEATDGKAADRDAILRRFRDEFVLITPGKGKFPKSFQMGGGEQAAQPTHEVEFDYSFFIAKYETTQDLWTLVMGQNPSRWQGRRNSVEMLTFDEANEFCRRVTKLLREVKRIEPDQIVRLPTEAEWEYCARAGTNTKYSFGDLTQELDEHAWHTGNAAGNDPPVGALKPNAWQLYDVHGYLWEWCSDTWTETYEKQKAKTSDSAETDKTARRVVRSGSWKDPAANLTSSFRMGLASNTKDDAVGFRCVLAKTKKGAATSK